MKKIDLYIIRKFLSTFFFILGVIMLIAVIFDISEKLDDFLENDAPLKDTIFDYYINFMIYYGNLFAFLLIFISVIFFTSRMASRTEIVAILSSGVSFWRMMFPYMVSATLLAGASYYLNHWVVPDANKVRLAYEELYIRKTFKVRGKNLHRQIKEGENIYFGKYNAQKNTVTKFGIEKWDGIKLVYKLSADFLRWDSVDNQWTVENYTIRTIEDEQETLKHGKKIDTTFAFVPEDFERRLNTVDAMNTRELKEFIEQERLRGSEFVPSYLLALYQRTSFPFATYILVLIGATIASRKVRGGIGVHLILGIAIAVSYILMMKVTTVYTTHAGFDPLYAVWMPNVVYGLLALFILSRAPK